MTSGSLAPYYVGGSAKGWELADYSEAQAASTPAAGGRIVFELPQVETDTRWLIDHATISCTSSTSTQCRWYDSTESALCLLDGTTSGNFDVGEWPDGLRIGPGHHLLMVWSGASGGAIGSFYMQVRLLRRAS